ncbi:MAG: PilZ domain-containing protein [Candidatus Omnitrophota bacterium]
MVNRRKFLRISTVLPVEFYILDEQGRRITPWLQGFTRDIGKGGMDLLVNDLWWGFWDKLKSNLDSRFFLQIELPFKNKPILIEAKSAWLKQENSGAMKRCFIGLEFLESNSSKAAFIFRYAVINKIIPFAVATVVTILLTLSFSLYWRAASLTAKNKKVVKDYVSIVEKKSSLEEVLASEKKNSRSLEKKQEELQKDITLLAKEILQWQEKQENLVKQNAEQPSQLEPIVFQAAAKPEPLESAGFKKQVLLEFELSALKRKNEFLKIKVKESKAAVSKIQEQVNGLRVEKLEYSPKIIQGMYQWVKDRQNPKNGLVLSYEGDSNLDRACFTYDQALAAMIFLVYNDRESAGKVLDFYLKRVKKGQSIYNAYFMKGDVFEYTNHCGPNAWIGLAALDYVKKTGDKKYLVIAREVGSFLFSMMDKEGGIKGGPKDSWYSTEHNLDAFAFFNLYYQLSAEEKYLAAAEKIKKWICSHTYTKQGPPIKRGKGDSTIATDTYAWSVTAFGPEELYSLKMNPEMILEFAVENCEVTSKFNSSGTAIVLRGFDFAKARNLARGGVISGEWTSQMVLAFEIMADYFEDKDLKKSQEYMQKAMFYFNELQKMLVISLSRVGKQGPCLPYASVSSVDTGHGWRTPKGDRTGSLASTAYFLLAYHGYNPLKAQSLSLSLKNVCEQELEERVLPGRERVEWTDVAALP